MIDSVVEYLLRSSLYHCEERLLAVGKSDEAISKKIATPLRARNDRWMIRSFLCFIFLFGLSFPSQAQFDLAETDLTGHAAPDFTLPMLDNNSVNFTKFRDGQKAIIFFLGDMVSALPRRIDKIGAKKRRDPESGDKNGLGRSGRSCFGCPAAC